MPKKAGAERWDPRKISMILIRVVGEKQSPPDLVIPLYNRTTGGFQQVLVTAGEDVLYVVIRTEVDDRPRDYTVGGSGRIQSDWVVQVQLYVILIRFECEHVSQFDRRHLVPNLHYQLPLALDG